MLLSAACGLSTTAHATVLADGITTAKRMVFNGSSSGFQSAYQANQLGNLTAYVVMSKTPADPRVIRTSGASTMATAAIPAGWAMGSTRANS